MASGQNYPDLFLERVRHSMSVTRIGASGCITEFIDMGTQHTRIFVLSDWCPLCSYLWKSCDNWDNPHPLKQLFKLWLFWQHSSSFITHRMQRKKRNKTTSFLFSFNPNKPRPLKRRTPPCTHVLLWLLPRHSHLLEKCLCNYFITLYILSIFLQKKKDFWNAQSFPLHKQRSVLVNIYLQSKNRTRELQNQIQDFGKFSEQEIFP